MFEVLEADAVERPDADAPGVLEPDAADVDGAVVLRVNNGFGGGAITGAVRGLYW